MQEPLHIPHSLFNLYHNFATILPQLNVIENVRLCTFYEIMQFTKFREADRGNGVIILYNF